MLNNFLVLFSMCFLITVIVSSSTIMTVNAQVSSEELTARVAKEKELSLEGSYTEARILIISNTEWSGLVQDSGFDQFSSDGSGIQTITFECGIDGIYSATFQKNTEDGEIRVMVIQNGKQIDFQETSAAFGIASVTGECYHPIESSVEPSGGGCLIATATFGSELAPQVQQLREIRDNSLLQTESGRSFMESFNQFYYSFSPGIADLERENPVFKEAVKLTITPLLSSLSLLNYVDVDTEIEVLGYGISLILLNVGMYFVLPAVVIHKVRKFVKS